MNDVDIDYMASSDISDLAANDENIQKVARRISLGDRLDEEALSYQTGKQTR